MRLQFVVVALALVLVGCGEGDLSDEAREEIGAVSLRACELSGGDVVEAFEAIVEANDIAEGSDVWREVKAQTLIHCQRIRASSVPSPTAVADSGNPALPAGPDPAAE